MIPEKLLNEYPEFESRPMPRLLREAAKTYGVVEWLGEGSNPLILGWAHVLATAGYKEFTNYTADSIPWCALWQSWITFRAGDQLPKAPGWSQGWKRFGGKVEGPEAGQPGDVAVFTRPDPAGVLPPGSLGHVGVVVRAEPNVIHLISGNNHDAKGDRVDIRKWSRNSLVAIRCPLDPIPAERAMAA